ncbi:phospholipid phosphatase [Leuconostoc inhae]|uniref:phospholipid phosphatase n=1 Tax=Leuconostoc inhae TaxID=178001 RepID=UPI001C7D9557|nr:phospholipid phosphatase [Leuconostoc inhae]
MLIQPDKLRKLLIVVFSALFLLLAIQIRFNMLFMHVIDNGASLVIQNLIPHSLQYWISFGGLFTHYWILVPAMALVSSSLYFMNYKIAMWWFIVTQVLAMILALTISVILKIHWLSGPKLGPTIPNILLVLWLQILAIAAVIIMPRLVKNRRIRQAVTIVTIMLWLLMLMACIQRNDMPFSSGLGSLFFGYFWWQLSEQQYRKRAKHWRHVLEIDTLI